MPVPVSGRRQPRGRALGGRGVRLGYHLDPLVRLMGGLLLCCRSGTSGLHRARGGRRAGGVGRSAGPLPALPRRPPREGGGVAGRERVGRPRQLGIRRTGGSGGSGGGRRRRGGRAIGRGGCGGRGRGTVGSGARAGGSGEAVAGREGAGGRGTDGTVGGLEGLRKGSSPTRPAASPTTFSRSSARPKESSTRSRMLDAGHCIRKTPCVQSRRPHSTAVRGGATPGRWGPTGSPALPHPCSVPIACPSERTTTVNNGATSPSHLPPDNEFSQVSDPTHLRCAPGAG